VARLFHTFKLKSENKKKPHEQNYGINLKQRGGGKAARGASVVKTLQITTTWLE